MNVLPISEIRKRTVGELQELMPLKMLADGEPFAILVKPNDVIVLADLHPAVRYKLRAREQLARSAMGDRDVRPDYAEIAE